MHTGEYADCICVYKVQCILYNVHVGIRIQLQIQQLSTATSTACLSENIIMSKGLLNAYSHTHKPTSVFYVDR